MHVGPHSGVPEEQAVSRHWTTARKLELCAGVLMALLAAALVVALLSYHADDPSPDTATAASARNLAGPFGAAYADVALQFFGLAGFLPAAMLLAWGWRLASGGGLGSLPVRLAALLFGLPVSATLLSGLAIPLGHLPLLPHNIRDMLLPPPDAAVPIGAGPGGVIGLALSRAAIEAGGGLFGAAGAAMIWGAVVLLALVLVPLGLGLSWREWRAMASGVARLMRFLFRRGGRQRDAAWRLPAGSFEVEDDPDHVLPARTPFGLRRGAPDVAALPALSGGALAADPVESGRGGRRRAAARPAPAERREPALRGARGRTAEAPATTPLLTNTGWVQPPGMASLIDDEPPPPPRPRPGRTGRPPRPEEPPIALGGPAGATPMRPPVPADPPAAAEPAARSTGGALSFSRLLGNRAAPAAAPPAARRDPPSPPPPRYAAPEPENWNFPPLALLKAAPPRSSIGPSVEVQQENARLLETVLSDYGVQGAIGDIHVGPVVTLYELEPAPGIRAARVIGLADDIARSLSVTAVRIATVSGRNVIGIEVPNSRRETVFFSELLDADSWYDNPARLCLALGKDIAGAPVYADLARMPHLLIAGTTGSGKSVGINSMILSLLYRLSPDECRLIMIDPKMLELSIYDGIPHLMAPVVTEPAKAVTALKWTVREMERRYRGMSQLGVRNIGGYNERVAAAKASGERLSKQVQTGYDPETNKPVFEEQVLTLEKLPYIVVVIDEMADLMMVAGKEIEATVQRLAQMARAAGIHVIMATQRPSVDVITGTIKANFPTRISFQVISKFDSRTILGEQGSEQLLGQGDMLYMAGGGRITRVHGPFVADSEVEEVVRHLRAQGEPDYNEEVTTLFEDDAPSGGKGGGGGSGNGMGENGYDGETALFDQAVALVTREGKASTSFIQRHLSIGYNRAAKLIEQMEKEGVVSAANHVGRREVLARRMEVED